MRSLLKLGRKARKEQGQLGGWQFDALDETRPGRVMPGLPPELWVEILTMASEATEKGGSIVSYSLVSKAWNAYSQPALYHTIHITKSAQAKALALTLLCHVCSQGGGTSGSGRHIRYLTLATASYDRCDPSDILVIFQNATHLVGLYDWSSIRCPLLDQYSDSRTTPENLFALLLKSGTLTSLTWTSYPHLTHPLPISPLDAGFRQLITLHIYLPVDTDSDYSLINPFSLPLLNRLTLTLFDPIVSNKGYSSPPDKLLGLLSTWNLPALRILTINTPYTLHDTAESRLGEAFWEFFAAHGQQLAVLEFGRSNRGAYSVPYSKDVQEMEDRWIDGQVKDVNADPDAFVVIEPPSPSTFKFPVSLAALTPNLRTFICSASLAGDHTQLEWGLEWDWTHPDWLAPHPLLPAHPNITMIGIRDLGERVRADWEANDESFFTLYHQLSSLLLPFSSTTESSSTESTALDRDNIPFPNLKYIRDLDPDSDLLRRGVRHLGKVSSQEQTAPAARTTESFRRWRWRWRRSAPPLSTSTQNATPHISHSTLLGLWSRVLSRTRGGEVWLEDWRGWNLTRGNLERWARGV
ncbi:hypothetical protein BT96DRAFT_1012198 [Gymnopus androsaceus JB14]|uniref:Uncharacterized protein n=1 Tax=Gymnopus androsaceus JB14 TaxID=1447944 RepID=A0A6A4IH29_9AGAR|nr:hypothetical protein BT96DRAFT_1012198 [Gymnopus androsaceus JB14]